MRPVCEAGLPVRCIDPASSLLLQRVVLIVFWCNRRRRILLEPLRSASAEQCIVLAMSPVGAAFSRRCRLFPSLISCTTIDWYIRWPDDALLAVAQKKLRMTAPTSARKGPAVSEMCVIVPSPHRRWQANSSKSWPEYYIHKSLDLIALHRCVQGKTAEKQKAKDRLEWLK